MTEETSLTRQPRALPQNIAFPPALPVSERREDIARAIDAHQVVIVAGETGSGKTTQLPKICLSLGRGRYQRIGHTQPRRLAARTVAQRIAEELQSPLGELVGYQVRFTDSVSEASAVKLMTDGILLAELQHDKNLNQYDTIIIDEAHERSLNIDFILGYLKRLLPKRPDLKVIVTSATIDVERFSKHFNDAPIIEVSGRTYPVDIHYLGDTEDRDEGLQQQIVDLIGDIEAERFGPRGDVLVFLSGERDIRELAKQLKYHDRLQVLPLYARLSAAEQNKVFNPSGTGMRVVLATNVAETSLTVPGIRYVIDPGEARISRYSHRTRLQRLPIEKISKASANQRTGRCGRVGPGVCFRLYTEQDFASRPAFTEPEIVRTNLAAVILKMLQLRLGSVAGFPFIDAPEPKMVRDGYRLLEELGAVSPRGRLTQLGQQMARLPIDPKLARMIIAADSAKCLPEVAIIASAMAVQDPRERPADKRAQSDQAHARFVHPQSDFLSWLNLWQYAEEQRQALSQNQWRKTCLKEFLSFMRLREWRDIHHQLTLAIRQLGLSLRSEWADDKAMYAAVHKSLLSGLLGQIAQRDEGKQFNAARNRKIQIFPGSGQYRKPPPWLVAGEIVETSAVYARECAAIEPEWLLTINPHLLKRHYYEPSWQMRSGRVMAKERVSLFGLVIADGHRVHYGDIDPPVARELLIREALITGQYAKPPAFLKRNLALMRSIQELESKARRRDLLVDEESLFQFYDERLGHDCVSAAALQRWLQQDKAREQHLTMARHHILTRDPGAELEAQFPSTLEHEGVQYRLKYQFEPGQARDGVTVVVPLPLLNRAPRYRFDWLVPGLLREKCIALVKGLPKALRKQLVPVPDVVDSALATMVPGDRDLLNALSEAIAGVRRVTIPLTDWQAQTLPDFYRMNIQVVDERGKVLSESRDMAALVAQYRDTQALTGAAIAAKPAAAKPLSTWDVGDLPEVHRQKAAGIEVLTYPGLAPLESGVSLQFFDYASDALVAHRRGVLALALQMSAQTAKYLRKQLFTDNHVTLALAGCGVNRAELVEAVLASAFFALQPEGELPRTQTAFDQCLARSKGQWVSKAQEFERVLSAALRHIAEALNKLENYHDVHFRESVADIREHADRLLRPARISDASEFWINQYQRYGKALLHRTERLAGQLVKDQSSMALVKPFELALGQAVEGYPGLLVLSPPARKWLWMIEEFRVSLFAQQVGTKVPVSEKRLGEQARAVQSWLDSHPR
jgi:ATP-dependent helicase HrpA